jgi:hypothetical protein
MPRRQMGWYEIMHFGVVTVFESLTSADSLKSYLSENPQANPSQNFWLGHSLSTALVIDRLIHRVLDDPALFGISGKETVERAYQGDSPLTEYPTASKQGRLILGLATMFRPVLAVRSLTDFEVCSKQVRTDLVALLKKWVDQFVFMTVDDSNEISSTTVLENAGPVFLHFFSHDTRFIKLAFNDHFRQNQQHLGQARQLPEDFFEGYKASLVCGWRQLIGQSLPGFQGLSKLYGVETWKGFADLYGDIQTEIDEKFEEDLKKVTARKRKPFDSSFILQIAGPHRRVSPRTIERRLDEKFLHYVVRIIDEEWTGEATMGLIVALRGLVAISQDKVRVIRFIHGDADGSRFGYAVLLYAPNFLWNYSQWWLFNDFCNDYSGNESSSHKAIEDLLVELKSKVSVTSFRVDAEYLTEYVHTHPRPKTEGYPEELADYFETETLSGLRRLLAKTQNREQKAKGVALELLMVTLLSCRGFETRWSFKPKHIGKEFDVVGLKREGSKATLHVVECSNLWEDELIPELEGKIALLEGNMSSLLGEFRSTKVDEVKVVGSIATTDALDPKMTRTLGNISIIDREALRAECKEVKIGWPGIMDKIFPPKRFVPTINLGFGGEFKEMAEGVFMEE